jgi:hypothetical protein
MAMQTSGGISLSQIQAEHGGSNPASLSEYYKHTSYASLEGTGVPAISPNNNIPTSGAIHFSNFHGSEGITTIVIGSLTYNFNLRNHLVAHYGWNQSSPVAVYLVVNAPMWGTTTATAAITANLTTSSILSIRNNSYISGKGGAGGGGGHAGVGGPGVGAGGAAAGHAIDLQNIAGVVIRNYGYIRGGGGGGGGGGGTRFHGSYQEEDSEGDLDCVGGSHYAGGAGGVGAGYSSYASGAAGGTNTGNAAGNGGSGGGHGAGGAGGATGGGSGCQASNAGGGGGGAAGKAIRHVGGVLAQHIAVTGTINGATS